MICICENINTFTPCKDCSSEWPWHWPTFSLSKHLTRYRSNVLEAKETLCLCQLTLSLLVKYTVVLGKPKWSGVVGRKGKRFAFRGTGQPLLQLKFKSYQSHWTPKTFAMMTNMNDYGRGEEVEHGVGQKNLPHSFPSEKELTRSCSWNWLHKRNAQRWRR